MRATLRSFLVLTCSLSLPVVGCGGDDTTDDVDADVDAGTSFDGSTRGDGSSGQSDGTTVPGEGEADSGRGSQGGDDAEAEVPAEDGSAPQTGDASTGAGTLTLGGRITGLAPGNSVQLENNGGDRVSIATNGLFIFPNEVESGSAYQVTVADRTGDTSQDCRVNAGSGTVGARAVTSVMINCATNAFTVGGTLSGLRAGSVTLRTVAGETLQLTQDGAFAFPSPLRSGEPYAISISSQPERPVRCRISANTGTVRSAEISDVAVVCTPAYTVGGTVSGLARDQSVVLQNNGADDLTVLQDGSFVFPTAVDTQGTYAVTVLTNPRRPIAQTCAISDGAGVTAAADVVNVSVRCNPPDRYRSIATGPSGYHTCAITLDDSLWCWGSNSAGQLGDDSIGGNRLTPVAVGTAKWSKVSVGESNTCGIQLDGTLWCWGVNTNAVLGTGNRTNSRVPVRVAGSQTWKAVSLESSWACGIQSDDSLWCWGRVVQGTMQSYQVSPLRVGTARWKAVALSAGFRCGIQADDSLWCWGRNDAGVIGDGTTTEQSAPKRVGAATWKKIVTSEVSVCGLQSDDSLWCWGQNRDGAFGDGTTTPSLVPKRIGTERYRLLTAAHVDAVCGVRLDGTLWCWGNNEGGQLGNATLINSSLPVRTGLASTTVTELSAFYATVLALLPDNTLYGWGFNGRGALGDGTTTTRTQPQRVPQGAP